MAVFALQLPLDLASASASPVYVEVPVRIYQYKREMVDGSVVILYTILRIYSIHEVASSTPTLDIKNRAFYTSTAPPAALFFRLARSLLQNRSSDADDCRCSAASI